MITLSFKGTDIALIERIRGKAGEIVLALRMKLEELDIRLQAKIVGEKLQGQVLNQRTGKLAGSIRAIPVEQDGTQLVGSVQGGGGPAFYGRIQEYGGQSAYTIVPTNKKALAFMMGGKQVFAKMVHHPPLPARPFMRPSLDEMTPDFVSELQETMNEAAQ